MYLLVGFIVNLTLGKIMMEKAGKWKTATSIDMGVLAVGSILFSFAWPLIMMGVALVLSWNILFEDNDDE